MTKLEWALWHAENKRYVFPGVPNSKLPAIKDYTPKATLNPQVIKATWNNGHGNANINISTKNLIAVDVDVKNGKNGYDTLAQLELEQGLCFPPTFEQYTPTGGGHKIYSAPFPVKQGVDVLGPGLDIRADGGYVVGAGSTINGKMYTCNDLPISPAPQWLIDRCQKPREKSKIKLPDFAVDQESALRRARHYLEVEAPVAVQGQHGDQTTFVVICALKDMGLTIENANLAVSSWWNDLCSPPWEEIDLQMKVENAYKYGKDYVGIAAPEVMFKDVTKDEKLTPILELNKEYAFIIIKGKSFVIRETERDGKFELEYLNTHSFREKLLPKTLMFNDKKHQLADLWLKSPHRRSYDGICFMPGLKAPDNLYNLWRGFAYEPKEPTTIKARRAVELFLEHARENICAGDEALYQWLISYFAHLVQKPYEKPIVAPVFKGGKGVGKNSFIECIGELLNGHYLLVSSPRYLTGNFNSHLENCLLIVLDEAFWSGKKDAEGPLKDLITGKTHLIERKGSEPYTVKNCTRVVIIGNEDWLIPASHDERRFAVFNIGDKRKNDHQYFAEIREGMAAGGYRYLLKYLSEFDYTVANIHSAPATIGLMEQKISSLSPFYEWWLECLKTGRLAGDVFSTDWECDVDRDRFRKAYRKLVTERGLRVWGETDRAVGKLLSTCLPSVKHGKKQSEHIRSNTYVLPSLDVARKDWEKWIGYPFNWES